MLDERIHLFFVVYMGHVGFGDYFCVLYTATVAGWIADYYLNALVLDCYQYGGITEFFAPKLAVSEFMLFESLFVQD